MGCTHHSQWDLLTGGPGKPGWPWKPYRETRAEPDPTATPCPMGVLRGVLSPFGDTHLVPLLSGASREPALTPGTLRRDGMRWWEHPTAPTATLLPPHSPQGGHLPLAPRDRAARPRRGVPGKDRNGIRWMWLEGSQSRCPQRGGHLGETPAPLPLRDSPAPLSLRGDPRSLARL